MVEKMKKYTFVVYHKDYEQFLEKLCDIGVLHPAQKDGGDVYSDELQQNIAYYKRINSYIAELEKLFPEKEEKQQTEHINIPASEYIEALTGLFDKKERLKKELEDINKELSVREVWGEFDPGTFKQIEKAGWHVRLFTTQTRQYNPAWEEMYHAFIIATRGSVTNFITITKGSEAPDIDADAVPLPECSYSTLLKKQEEILSDTEKINRETEELAPAAMAALQDESLHVKDRISISTTKCQTHTGADSRLMLLQGWVPVPQQEAINAELEKEGVYFEISEPSEDDNVPIKLKNNKFAKLFEGVTALYDMPKYGTVDMTPYFAPFFALFFGICFGDMGYGILMVLIALLLKIKSIAAMKQFASIKQFASLLLYLGISTMAFGFISGNCFGIELADANWSLLKPVQSHMISTNDIFILALALGVIQILYGRILNTISLWIRFDWKHAMLPLGWGIVIAGCIIPLAMKSIGLISGSATDMVISVSLSISAACILLFSNPKRKGFALALNIPAGLYNIYENVIGLLGDVLSYIRLFALSLSGGVMAIVFNKLAMEMSGSIPIVKQLIMIVILLIGHGINIFMSGLGSFIHPMRLTFVEFYKNAGFEGGGTKYQPLKRSYEL